MGAGPIKCQRATPEGRSPRAARFASRSRSPRSISRTAFVLAPGLNVSRPRHIAICSLRSRLYSALSILTLAGGRSGSDSSNTFPPFLSAELYHHADKAITKITHNEMIMGLNVFTGGAPAVRTFIQPVLSDPG